MYGIEKETGDQGNIELSYNSNRRESRVRSSQGTNVMYSTAGNKQTWGGATRLVPEAPTDNGFFFYPNCYLCPSTFLWTLFFFTILSH